MSTLESEAKTTAEILKENKALWTQYFSKRTDERKAAAEAYELQKQWISLETAQRNNHNAVTLLKVADNTIEQLRTQLAEANRILNKLVMNAQTMNYYTEHADIRYTQRTQKWLSEYDLQELHQALKINLNPEVQAVMEVRS
jgi:hypothetical protein